MSTLDATSKWCALDGQLHCTLGGRLRCVLSRRLPAPSAGDFNASLVDGFTSPSPLAGDFNASLADGFWWIRVHPRWAAYMDVSERVQFEQW